METSWIEKGIQCCEEQRLGNYCPDCGKNLDIERDIEKKDYPACRGTGKKDHFCT